MTKNLLFFNGCFDKNRIKSLISWSFKNCGEKITIDLVENLKTLGFEYATEAGISLGIDDLKIPPIKAKLISEADTKIKFTQINYKQSYLTGMEKFQQLIDTWHRTSEILKQNVIQYFKSTDILNPVYMMAFSGARGNISQVRQLVGMRGLMSDPQGQILDFPIKSNFREGLTLTEYIISCYGARKGLVDTALKTANSGYLTRRLVDVSHHIIISDFDCKTKRGILLNTITENQKVIVPLQKRLIGRILAENIYSKNPATRRVVSPNSSAVSQNNQKHKKSKDFKNSIFVCDEKQQKNSSTKNNTTQIFTGAKIKQKLVFTNPLASLESVPLAEIENVPLLNTNCLENQVWFQTKKFSNLGCVNVNEKNTNSRVLALFFQLIFDDCFFNLERNKNHFYELWDISNKTTEEILIFKQQRDFYWQQSILFLNHVTLAFSNQILIAPKNKEISVSLAAKIAILKNQVLVRSPLTCEMKNSLCQLCYGWSLAHGKLVSLGEAVGIIAGQSIGEPGTQLTMRTFHTGGVFSGDVMNEIRAPFNGKVEFPSFFQGILIRTPHGKIAFLTKVPGKFTLTSQENLHSSLPETSQLISIGINEKYHENTIKTSQNITFEIPTFTVLFVRNQEHVIKTQLIAEFSSISTNRNQQIQANHDLNAELEGEVCFQDVIEQIQIKKKKIINKTTYNLGNIWIFSGKIYQQPVFFTLFPQSGDIVNMNSVMGQYSSISPYNGILDVLPNSKDLEMEQIKKQNEHSLFELEVHSLAQLEGLLNTGKRNSYNKLPSKKVKIEPLTRFFPRTLQNKASSNLYKIYPSTINVPFLNHTLICFVIKSIQYKKIGYFLSFSNSQNSSLSLDRFFLSNSLKQKFKNSTKLKTNFYFQSFPKQYQTETGGIVIYDNFYLNEKLCFGEIFWVPEETYSFCWCNFINFHFKPCIKNLKKQHSYQITNFKVSSFRKNNDKTYFFQKFKKRTNYKKWTNKNNSVVFYHNSQGKISSFSSKLNGYIQSYPNYVLSNNQKKGTLSSSNRKFGASIPWQPKAALQRKKIQLSLVTKKKENKLGNLADNFFPNFQKIDSQILYKSNLKKKKQTQISFRLNPISFYNVKYQKLYFALFKNNHSSSCARECSSILQPQIAWENNKKHCKLINKSKYSKHSTISQSKRNKTNTLINLLKIKNFNSEKSKHEGIKTSNLNNFENNLSKISQNFLHKKNLRILNKKTKFKLKIKPGWIYFPTSIKQTISKQNNIIQPGVVCLDDILFDQYSVYLECFSFNKFYTQNLFYMGDLQVQIKVKKNTNLKHTINFQLICNEFNLNENTNLFSATILAKPNIYCFFINLQNSKFKNFFAPNFSTGKKTLRNKKLLLNNFKKKYLFLSFLKKNKKNIYNYDKIYFLQTSNFSRKYSLNIINNCVLPILIPLKTTFCFHLTTKQIVDSNEKQFTGIKNMFIPKFFVLIRKVKPYSFISLVKYKSLLAQQNQYGPNSLIAQNKKYKTKIHFICFSWFNQQKITQLFFNSSSPDFIIKPYLPYKEYKKSVVLKNTILLKFFILFLIPKHYAINIVQIKFISQTQNNQLQYDLQTLSYTATNSFKNNKLLKNIDFLLNQQNKLFFDSTWYLNFSILREFNFSNELVSKKLNTKSAKNTLLFYSKNAISNQIPISFTKFFSPLQGEILNLQTVTIKKLDKNYLILTDKDQVTFSLNYFPEHEILRLEKSSRFITRSKNKKILVTNVKPPSPNYLGNFIGYGTKILDNLSIPQSGQIIQIHKSKIVIRKVQSILFSRKGILSVYNGKIIEKNSLVLSLFYQRLKTGDIVQGIPKIEQLFEARKTNQGEILRGSLHEKLESIFKYYKKKYNPETAANFSLTKIQQIIVNNVQEVYQSQGVTIAEKHLEIIVRQMTSKVQIVNSGQTNLLRGEIVDLDWIKTINKGIPSEKVQYKPIILGITKKSLETKSFISEASFQETTRILAKSAIQRRTDFLKGLKENVILGHVIPAGTGFSFSSGKDLNTNQLKFSQTDKILSFDIFKKKFSK